jgi:ABC-2 type transport system permease protein
MTVALVAHQTRLERRTWRRSPEAAFATLLLPVGLVLIIGATNSDSRTLSGLPAAAAFIPGMIVFGIIAATYANLASTLVSVRATGVLKRLRSTPLPQSTYLAGVVASAVITTAMMAVATIAAGWLAFDVAPVAARLPSLVAGVALGAACFASLGAAVSTLIPRPDAAGPITNATYLPVAFVSGVFSSHQELPGLLDRVVGLLPVKPLVDVLSSAFDPAAHLQLGDLAVLVAWAVAGAVIARRRFRWEP